MQTIRVTISHADGAITRNWHYGPKVISSIAASCGGVKNIRRFNWGGAPFAIVIMNNGDSLTVGVES